MPSVFTIASSAAGPLPLKFPFNPPLDGPATMMFSGTAWSHNAGAIIGVQVQLDGKVIGTAQLCSNSTSEHKTLPSQLMPVNLTDGTHTITLVPLNGNTVTDLNDNFSVWLLM